MGSHLCERLFKEGRDVICADNFFMGTKENIAHLLDNSYFELLRHDVAFPLFVEVEQIHKLSVVEPNISSQLNLTIVDYLYVIKGK